MPLHTRRLLLFPGSSFTPVLQVLHRPRVCGRLVVCIVLVLLEGAAHDHAIWVEGLTTDCDGEL